jgi:hypothetical protein
MADESIGGVIKGLLGGSSIGGLTSSFSSAVSDLYGAGGDRAEARQYDNAEQYALEEANFTDSATRIKEMQTMRQLLQATGAEQAGYAGSGLAMSGSAQDVLRDSAQQGALALGAIQFQGAETKLGFQEQATSYSIMADAARSASKGAGVGAVVSGLAGLANLVGLGSSVYSLLSRGDGVLPGGKPLGQGGIGHE